MRGLTLVDGDSVAFGVREGVEKNQTWAALFGENRGVTVRNLAIHQNTIGASLEKLPQILGYSPAWYIAQFGQWSLFRPRGDHCAEPVGEFRERGRLLIEALQASKVSVCFVTPPPQLYHWGFARDIRGYLAVIRELKAAYSISLLDAHSYMAEDIVYNSWKEVDSWFDAHGRDPLHYSAKGHAKVAEYFNLPEHRHIGI